MVSWIYILFSLASWSDILVMMRLRELVSVGMTRNDVVSRMQPPLDDRPTQSQSNLAVDSVSVWFFGGLHGPVEHLWSTRFFEYRVYYRNNIVRMTEVRNS